MKHKSAHQVIIGYVVKSKSMYSLTSFNTQSSSTEVGLSKSFFFRQQHSTNMKCLEEERKKREEDKKVNMNVNQHTCTHTHTHTHTYTCTCTVYTHRCLVLSYLMH